MAINKWDAVLNGPPVEGFAETLGPVIIADVCANYLQERTDGTTCALLATRDFPDKDQSTLAALFLSIQRRAGGGRLLRATDAHRDRLVKELLRMPWPKGKPPELSDWYFRARRMARERA